MSFLRIEKKKSGTYLRILESYRDEKGKARHRILYNLGKVEDYSAEQLQKMGLKLYELGGGDLKRLFGEGMEELARYNYGYQQIYGKAYQHFGLGDLMRRIKHKSKIQFALSDAVLLMLLQRLQFPCSKLENYHRQDEYVDFPKIELHHIYRALDKLAAHKESIQDQIYSIDRDLFNNQLDVVFYDVTTFYFDSEVEQEDALRQKGFGKDGKVGKTQVLFSMMIDKNKNPVGYNVYKGDTYEGHTFKDALDDLKKRYHIDKVIIVADRGMLSKANILKTIEHEYDYIMGERLKNLPKAVQKVLLDPSNYKQEWVYLNHDDEKIPVQYTTLTVGEKTIICTYSAKRAKRDQEKREKKIDKAKELLKQPSKLKTKSRRFFIKTEGESEYQLDEDKIKRAAQFDGFLAISTNTAIKSTEVLEQYKQLYQIEHSFRTLKSHLEIRPMFHWTDARIEGHICMCYMAFALQNWVLQKVNKQKKRFTENTLRKCLDKMQLSLVKNGDKQFYIRSVSTLEQGSLQKAIGVKQLPPLIPKDGLSL